MAFHKHVRTGSFHKELERSAIKVQKQDGMGKNFSGKLTQECFLEGAGYLKGLKERRHLQPSIRKFSLRGID